MKYRTVKQIETVRIIKKKPIPPMTNSIFINNCIKYKTCYLQAILGAVLQAQYILNISSVTTIEYRLPKNILHSTLLYIRNICKADLAFYHTKF